MSWPGAYTATNKPPALEMTAITILWIGSPCQMERPTVAGGTTMAAIHGPGGPLVMPCLVWLDHLRRGQPTV